MIDVKLLSWTNTDPLMLASNAGKWAYQGKPPEDGQPPLAVQNVLFDAGHHTTFQHWVATFGIDGIDVGDIKFGLHMCSPFYNSDERSGRFCGEMFANPNLEQIEAYIKAFWPALTGVNLYGVMSYIRMGLSIYQEHLSAAITAAKQKLREERPKATQGYIDVNAGKMAQEQLRVFIPLIFPTGLIHTVNISALAALYRSAWNPVLRYVYGAMAALVTKQFPEAAFMFTNMRQDDWVMPCWGNEVEVRRSPKLSLLWLDDLRISPNPASMHPVDLLHFSPEFLASADSGLKTRIEISALTTGQDQRHRTIHRGMPVLTGNFYLPPLFNELVLASKARELMGKWLALMGDVPETLHRVLAPYGAMVAYNKTGSFNAVIHEQAKRLCWCAQEEIYNLSRLLRSAVDSYSRGSHPLLQCMEPHCYKTGKCAEGKRYCGRDIADKSDYFRRRHI